MFCFEVNSKLGIKEESQFKLKFKIKLLLEIKRSLK